MIFRTLLSALVLLTAGAAAAAEIDPALQSDIAAPGRTEANRVRDAYRHPAETLSFFGVQPGSAVVEITPGEAGYWTEILAPYLQSKGRYVAALGAPDNPEGKAEAKAFARRTADEPQEYGKVDIASFQKGQLSVPPGSADFVLTFRNLHNWMAHDEARAALQSFYAALKPGGVLGIEDHRARETEPQDPHAKSGYVRQDYAVALAESVGFRFAGASEANANPKDTKDYSVGVWALPPTYRLKDVDHDKYHAIGESDRFTLKFIKP